MNDKSEDWTPGSGEDQEVQLHVARLKDGGPGMRESAVLALEEIGSEKAVESLTLCLKDQDPKVRWQSAAAPGKIGDARTIPFLEELQDDKGEHGSRAEKTVGVVAQEALGMIRSKHEDRTGKE